MKPTRLLNLLLAFTLLLGSVPIARTAAPSPASAFASNSRYGVRSNDLPWRRPSHRPSVFMGGQVRRSSSAPTEPVAQETQARLEQSFGQLPLYFVENQGQLDERVAYYIQGSDKTIYFSSEGVTFALQQAQDLALTHHQAQDSALTDHPPTATGHQPPSADHRMPEFAMPDPPSEIRRWVVKLDFVDANPGVRPIGQEQTEAIISYFKGAPDEWHAGLPTYSRIVYADLWPGIDLVYYGTVGQLKYEFIVHPGADPAQIRLAYRGATDVTLNAAGQLQVSTPAGSFADDTPVAYQEIDGRRVPIEMNYHLLPDARIDGERVTFEGATFNLQPATFNFAVGPYDPTRPLILDPAVLVYCGYIGGSGYDYGFDIALDEADNAYVTGHTTSTEATFPVTVGPDLTHNGSDYDTFVAKVNADGSALVYAGYIGGAGTDWGADIAVGGAGNAYVTGYTRSTEATFPVTVGPDLTHNDYGDAFVAKVNATGSALVYTGYIGGSGYDYGYDIAVDGAGNAYVTGFTYSTEATFPVTVGPDLTFNGHYDVFVAKVNAAGSDLVYAGYIGGTRWDSGTGIAVDGAGNAYVTGSTMPSQATFPVTLGPDLTYNGGDWDAFVAKVNAAGSALVYAGYIGGSSSDGGGGIAVDEAGNAYVTGWTVSTEVTFPVTVGPDLTFNGNYDAFVAKVNTAGSDLVYAGYIGGSDSDQGGDIAVDGAGNAYVTGWTKSTEATFPVTVGPDLTHNGGREDAFVAQVNVTGSDLVYAGYVGGSNRDWAVSITVDGAGNAYVTGYTYSTEATFPVTVGPDLTYNVFLEDAFVAKVRAMAINPITLDFGADLTELLLYINPADPADAWTLSESIPWLELSSTGGTGSTIITASVDRSGWPVDTYRGVINGAVSGEAVTVDVRMEVSPPTLSPIYPLADTISSTVMAGGTAHRYYRLLNSDSSPISGATVGFDVGGLQSGYSLSDDSGLVDIALDGGIVAPTTTLTISVTQVSQDGTPIAVIEMPVFQLYVVPREFETAWAGGATMSVKGGAGAPGLVGYLKGEVGGGLELALRETTPLTDTDDSLLMRRQYSVGAGVGVKMGAPSVGSIRPLEVRVELMGKAIQELELILEDPYADEGKKAEAALLLATLMDIARAKHPFGVALIKALIEDEAYLDYVVMESTAYGVEGTFRAGLGAEMELGGITMGLTLAEVEATLLLYGEFSDYYADNLRGVALEQDDSIDIGALQLASAPAKTALLNHIDMTDKVREELFFNRTTGALDHFELSFIGESNVNGIDGETTVTFIIDGDNIDETVLAIITNLAMLMAVYNHQPNYGVVIGPLAMVKEIENLLNSVPMSRYEIEVGNGASLTPIHVSDLSLEAGIVVGLGGGIDLETRQRSIKASGVVLPGGDMQPVAEYEPYAGLSGKELEDLLSHALHGAWLLVKDSFSSIVEIVESGVDWFIGLVTSKGGALITGSTAIEVNPPASTSGARASAGTIVTVSGVGWTEDEFAVGGVYQFSPEETTFDPGATLSITYTQSAATGLDESAFQIYRWDSANDNWSPLVSSVYSATNLVTTTITQLGTYVIGHDDTDPQIKLLLPSEDGEIIENQYPPITVIITDTDSGVNPASIEMKINDQVVSRQYDTYFHLAWYTPTVPMEYGDYTLFVSAEDMAGNATSLSVDFEIAESQIPVTITKTVTPQGPVNYGDELTYTLVISAAPGVPVRLYDPLTDTTFMRFLPQAHPPGVEHVNGVITGTLAAIAPPINQITVSFVARVDVPGTAGLTVEVANRACVYLFGGTLGDRICSDTVTNEAFRPYDVYLPIVLRRD